ncbi:DNA-3-methyladenine glycosylase 2 family protein [Phyllobacterium salinisoli]|uniref:DNA-3-methyladenine glycosylase II n=1 Tax=Phyllobacterium salinisoli TaxID=1899321 RepID=A0A368K302_9HYPH|nr:DNA-3-methyladenine glycosylase [Phyllobacterium salinisoli]RCS23768.1 DNA-3-methyladenine glycosylase 2 family protein [Phyllobacterium salinisoli]
MRRIDTLDDIEEGVRALVAADARLAPIHAMVTAVPLRRSMPGFESLASIIVAQQVSTASAAAIWARLKTHVDPLTPENYLGRGEEAWRLAGLSRPKQSTLAHVSKAVLSGELDLLDLCALPAEEAIATMTAIKGIGPWTAEVYLLFAAGHPDVFPAGDVALQSAVGHAFGHESRPGAADLRAFAEAWSPWRGVAARLFWAYYATIRGREAAPML